VFLFVCVYVFIILSFGEPVNQNQAPAMAINTPAVIINVAWIKPVIQPM
jgi:hypothetical protein